MELRERQGNTPGGTERGKGKLEERESEPICFLRSDSNVRMSGDLSKHKQCKSIALFTLDLLLWRPFPQYLRKMGI